MIIAAIVVFIILECMLFHYENHVWGFIIPAIVVAVLWYWGPAATFFASIGWVGAAKYLLVYLAIGCGVALLKWILFNLKNAQRIADAKRVRKLDMKNNDDRYQLLSAVNGEAEPYHKIPISDEELINRLTPKARNNVDKLSLWALEWPFVCINFIIADFFMKVGNWLASIFDAVLNKTARALTAKALS